MKSFASAFKNDDKNPFSAKGKAEDMERCD